MKLIKNGNVITMENGKTEILDILIDGERIVEVGKEIESKDAQIIDAKDMYIVPGFIDAHCHLGLYEDGENESEGDGNELTDPITPQLRAIDAINPFDYCFTEARENGVLLATTGPGSGNVIGGQFCVIKTNGKCIDEMIVKAPSGLKAALGENPKRVYGEQQKTPSTRMGIASLLRETLLEASLYKEKMDDKDNEDKPDRDLKMEIICDVLDKKIPLKIHCHRSDDILTALRIKKEFDLDISLDHCTQGHLIPEYLKGEKVILGPLTVDRCKSELRHLSIKAPKILSDNGVEFAIATDHPVIPIQYLPISVALAVREGLDEYEGLKAITINPAKILGIDKDYGSITKGKIANIAVFDRFPLDILAKTKYVFMDGELIFER